MKANDRSSSPVKIHLKWQSFLHKAKMKFRGQEDIVQNWMGIDTGYTVFYQHSEYICK